MARKNIAFPQVLRNAGMKACVVIYWKKAEYYGGPHKGCNVITANIDNETKYDPFVELQMCLDNGFKFVHPARDNYGEQEAYVSELESKIAKIEEIQNNCPEGGCLVEEA